jgi:arylsulfatase A-like enzyme
MSTVKNRPNVLILCMDQWDMHMKLPDGVALPTLRRLEQLGVTLDAHYCTVPICTPSRTTMWTGQHAKTVGMWDNTNFPWISSLSSDTPTLGTMMRNEGYYTAFKGKWHVSEVDSLTEDALDAYGFSDYQLWGDCWGAPLEGEMKDGAVAFETVDWLQHKAPTNQPWLLVSSLVNPHDIMYHADEDEFPGAGDNAVFGTHLHPPQDLGITREWFDPDLPPNFDDDLSQMPYGPRAYKQFVEAHYTTVRDENPEAWKKRRNYLINCMRLVDQEFAKIVAELDRQNLWENTIVIFTSDHGEMNGAHKMHQKGGIHYQEATVVNMTAIVPGGERGVRSNAVGSHVDLAPTVLGFAGVTDAERAERYPQLPGRNLAQVMHTPSTASAPRGSTQTPGDGALLMWDGLHQQDPDWSATGALFPILNLPQHEREKALKDVGRRFGAPDFTKRTFYRAVVDGRYKLVRWFSPLEYATPKTVAELYETADIVVHDLLNDPHELQNIGDRAHPQFDADLVAALLAKLNALIDRELGEDHCPIDLDLFGTRDVTYSASTSP